MPVSTHQPNKIGPRARRQNRRCIVRDRHAAIVPVFPPKYTLLGAMDS